MSVVIFHPSVAPFVQQAARALAEAGLLECFYTTLIDDSESTWQRFTIRASRLVGRDLTARLRRRRLTEVARSKVKTYPLGELLRLCGGSVDPSGRLTDLLWERSERRFSQKVGRHLHRELKGLYGYEFSARDAFVRARELGMRTFYDVPAPEPTFVEKLLQAELDRFPELRTPYSKHTDKREARRTAHRRIEWDLADRVVAASEFTRQSFAAGGRDISKIRVIPYGAPLPAYRELALRPRESAAPLRFVWAGTFSLRKGAHHLLDAWERRGLGKHATLDVYGSVTLPPPLVQRQLPGVRFHGPIARGELLTNFQRADALVFPTLCDGFGMVVTEAWSQGLPVILTDRAGASDLAREAVNSFRVPAGDPDALGERLESLVANPAVLEPMREGALLTATTWQWSDYRRELGELVRGDLQLS